MKENEHYFGFTLTELLVVIAVISILTSMLLPALKRARESAGRVACTNNFSQIAKAVNIYATDYNGYIPVWRNWAERLAEVFNESSVNGAHHAREKYNKGILLCPSTDAPGDTGKGWNVSASYSGEPFRTSYGLTTTAGSAAAVETVQGGWQLYTDSLIPKRIGAIKTGSVICIEKGLSGPCWGVIIVNFANTAWRTNAMQPDYGVQYRHRKCANFLFNDGHVESLVSGSQFSLDWEPK